MDKLLYIAASGASQDLLGTSLRANNLANAQTTGFRAQFEQARAMPAYGEGMPTRVFAMTESPGNDYESGAMIQTGRDLDVAVQGDGWLSVLDKDGKEAYTRAGNLQMGPNGELTDGHGHTMMGDNGPIFLPIPVANINIGNDGTISIRPFGAPETVMQPVDRLRLVQPEVKDMARGMDGLFRLQDGQRAEESINVQVRSGMLEGSNVNPIEEMVSMINLQRHYELQVKLMKKADSLDTRGNTLLRIL